jgi:hypothetical protein
MIDKPVQELDKLFSKMTNEIQSAGRALGQSGPPVSVPSSLCSERSESLANILQVHGRKDYRSITLIKWSLSETSHD